MPLLAAGATASASLVARCGPFCSVTNHTFANGGVYDGNLTNNGFALSFVVSPSLLSVTSATVTETPGGTNAVVALVLVEFLSDHSSGRRWRV